MMYSTLSFDIHQKITDFLSVPDLAVLRSSSRRQRELVGENVTIEPNSDIHRDFIRPSQSSDFIVRSLTLCVESCSQQWPSITAEAIPRLLFLRSVHIRWIVHRSRPVACSNTKIDPGAWALVYAVASVAPNLRTIHIPRMIQIPNEINDLVHWMDLRIRLVDSDRGDIGSGVFGPNNTAVNFIETNNDAVKYSERCRRIRDTIQRFGDGMTTRTIETTDEHDGGRTTATV